MKKHPWRTTVFSNATHLRPALLVRLNSFKRDFQVLYEDIQRSRTFPIFKFFDKSNLKRQKNVERFLFFHLCKSIYLSKEILATKNQRTRKHLTKMLVNGFKWQCLSYMKKNSLVSTLCLVVTSPYVFVSSRYIHVTSGYSLVTYLPQNLAWTIAAR